MKGKYKQHIVGIIVLIAIGVIFYPFLFTREDVDSSPVFTTPEPPPRPIIPHYVEPSLARDALVEIADIGDGTILRTSPLQDGEVSHITEVDDVITPSGVATVIVESSDAPIVQVEASGDMMGTDGLSISWTLQLAALSSGENANAMVAKLRDAGYQAYVRKSVAGGKTLFRVYIGPELDKQKLEKLRPAIDKAYGVSSLAVRFLP